jgi:hypothetical protein
MTHPSSPQSARQMPVLLPVPEHDVPTLSPENVLATVPEAVRLALDARAAEKHALLALSDDLVHKLRPEIERLTAEVVHKTLSGVWEKRAKTYRGG